MLIVILIGIFNLLIKVLFDVQINAYYPAQRSVTAAAPSETASLSADSSVENRQATDPKTRFIGRYKASISIVQVLLQILFVYFFAILWLNGKVLYAYPLLLIPNLLFISGVYLFKSSDYQSLIFWGTISACTINDLLKRVIFDSSPIVLVRPGSSEFIHLPLPDQLYIRELSHRNRLNRWTDPEATDLGNIYLPVVGNNFRN